MAVDRQDPSSRPVRPRPHCGEAPLQANGKHRPRSSEPFGPSFTSAVFACEMFDIERDDG